MKLSENYCVGDVSNIADTEINQNLQELKNKILQQQHVSLTELTTLLGAVKNSNKQIIKESLKAVISLLDHAKKGISFIVKNDDLLKVLIANQELFEKTKLTNDQFELIMSNYVVGNHSDSHQVGRAVLLLLKVISQHQPLPQTTSQALTKIIKVNCGLEGDNKLILAAINNSLKKDQLLSTETIKFLAEFIPAQAKYQKEPSKALMNVAENELKVLGILLSSGNLDKNQSQRLGLFKNHSSEKIKAKASKLLEEYKIGYQENNIILGKIKNPAVSLVEKQEYIKIIAKYLAVFSSREEQLKICQFQVKVLEEVSSKMPAINFIELGITNYLEKAIIRSSNPNLLCRKVELLFNKSINFSPKTINALINKLPLKSEAIDKNILNLIIKSQAKIDKIKANSLAKIKNISKDSANSEAVRNSAKILYDKIISVKPSLSIAAKVEVDVSLKDQNSSVFSATFNQDENSNKNNNLKNVVSAVVDNKQAILQANAVGDDRNLADNGHEAHYWYSIGDIDCLLLYLRKTYLHYQRTSNFGEEYISVRENTDGVFLADSYTTLNFASNLSDDVAKIISGVNTRGNASWNSMPTTIIIPILSDLHWRVVNVEINYEAKTASISLNDPYGANGFSNELKAIIQETVKANVQLLIRKSLSNNNFSSNFSFTSDLPVLEDTTNQQGCDNDWDCGPINFNNVKDYLEFATHLKAQLEFTIGANNEENHAAKIEAVRNADIVIYRQISSGIHLPANAEEEVTNFTKQNSNSTVKAEAKTLAKLTGELIELNTELTARYLESTKLCLAQINKASNSDSILAPQNNKINNYSKTEILAWAKAVRKLHLSLENPEHKSEIMAGIARAVELDKGYSAREVQQLSVLLLLNSNNSKGRLLQIKTGEGKSTITAMLAAAKILFFKQPVDIITSSQVLAKRDSHEQSNFFSLLDLTCAHNCFEQNTGFKICYAKDIVYGDSLSFQADLLRSEFNLKGTRGERPYFAVIVDEVDSMLIDEAAKIAKLALPICGMEHLGSIFIFIANQLKQMDISAQMLTDENLAAQIENNLNSVIEKVISPGSGVVVIPNFLKNFVSQQSKNWARSALNSLKMQENVDYVITINEDGIKVIAPVDYSSTGVVQTNTSWPDGLQQFLQIKHLLEITPERLTTSFISNLSFFKRYGANISGMTGTLGSEASKNLLNNLYNLESIVIPTFKPKIFLEFPGQVADNKQEHIESIVNNALAEAKNGRAVLIIAETIAEGSELFSNIKKRHSGNCLQYLRTDEDLGPQSFNNKCGSGDIIVATNLAGRGTDIITSNVVEDAGGLHVIITFLPSNLRVEEQAFGRTSRQGNKGSGQLIINREDLQNLPINFSVDELKKHRDAREASRLEAIKNDQAFSIEFEDNLFQRFNKEIYQPLRQTDKNKQKLLQLEDLWGFWLFTQKNSKQAKNIQDRQEMQSSFEQFKQQMHSKYNNGVSLMVNPAYMSNYVLNKLGNDSNYFEPCNLLSDPDQIDPYYSYQLHYLRALSQLRHNASIHSQSQRKTVARQQSTAAAFASLQKALMQIQSVIEPQLQSAMLQLGAEAMGSDLHKQLDNKLRLLDTAVKNLKENIAFIQSNNQPGKNTIIIGGLQHYDKLFKNEISIKEINEQSNFGLSFLYNLNAKTYAKDYLSGTLVAIAGIAQVVVGAIIATVSAGFAAEFGVSLAVGGVTDIITGVRAAMKGQEIDLGSWIKGKGIEIAVALAMAGISSSLSSGSKVAKGGVSATGKEVIKKLPTMSAASFGVAIVKRLATSYIVDLAVKGATRACVRPIKEEIKDLEEAIKYSLGEPRVNAQLQKICLVDILHRPGGEVQQFQSEVLSVINRKNSQFASITQSLVSHAVSSAAVSKATSNSYANAANAVVTAASTGYSVAVGIENVRSLKSFLLSGIDNSASSVHAALPDFTQMLSYSCLGADAREIAAITSLLQANGTLKGSIA